MKTRIMGLLALVAAILLVPGALSPVTPAQAVPPITVIAYSGDSLNMLPGAADDFGPPGVHDTGQVAFVAQGGGACNLYMADGSAPPLERAVQGSQVILPGGAPGGSLNLCWDMHERAPVLNVGGDVVFQGFAMPGLRAIYVQPGGAPYTNPPLTLVQQGETTPLGGFFGRPTLIGHSTDCDNNIDDDPGDDGAGNETVNDGCPQVGAASEAAGPQCTNAIDDDGDGAVNDGCPVVGGTAEMGTRILFHAPVASAGVNEGYFTGPGPGWLVPWTTVVADNDTLSFTAGGGSVSALGDASMNDVGQVVWQASVSGGDAEEGIYMGSTPTTTLVVDANEPESDADCSNPGDDDGDGLINEGCPEVAFSGEVCDNSTDDDNDGLVNDGCPTVGDHPEGGRRQCDNAVNDDPIDDGGTPRVNDGCPAFEPEVNQCEDNINADPYDDSTVNDGCAQVGSTQESGADCNNNVNDDSSDDMVVNDGCGTQGSTAETNQCDTASDEDGDGAPNDGCPTGGQTWELPPGYSDPYTTVSEPRINDDGEVFFRATTASGYTGYFGGPIGSLEKLVIEDDPWYGGDSFETLSGGGPCDNDENDDPTDDSMVNDGCPQMGDTPDSVCSDAVDDDGDGYVNDGCATVGTYPEHPYASSEAATNSSNGSQVVLRGTSAGGADIGVITFPHFQKVIRLGESSSVGGAGATFGDVNRMSTSQGGLVAVKADVNETTSCGFSDCKVVVKIKPACLKDSDGDGLCDDWETNGIDIDNDNIIDLNLQNAPLNADPDKKDIFVEVDYMDCAAPAEPDVGLEQGSGGQPCAPLPHNHKPLGGIIEGGVNGPIATDSCTDGLNNDGDAFTDTADPDCSVVKAFEDSPAYNPTDSEDGAGANTCNDGADNGPDGLADQFDPDCQGITLHVFVDERMGHADYLDFPTPAGKPAGACSPGSGGSVVDGQFVANFNLVKAKHFGSLLEQGNAKTLKAKFKVFHYALFTHRQDPNDNMSSGCGEIVGNDFYVSLGGWQDGVNDLDEHEGTFMHELGHTLGLCHAGPAALAGPDGQCHPKGDVNYKPNYLSIMNYTFQMSQVAADPGNPQANTNRPLDYSRWALPSQEDGFGPGTCDDGIDNGGDWAVATHDVGIDGSDGTHDFGERNNAADPGEPNVDRGDPDCYIREPGLNESVGIDGGIVDVTSEDGAGAGTCSDGSDNGGGDENGDTIVDIDAADPDCAANGVQARTTAFTRFPFESLAGTNTSEDGAGPGTCYDGVDNAAGPPDGADLFDTDCRNCNDGMDNEPDGLIDWQGTQTQPPDFDPQCICAFVTDTATGWKDWNDSAGGAADGFNVIAPIKDPPRANHAQCWGNTPGQTLKGYNDWLNLRYNFRFSQGYSDGVERGVLPPDQDATVVADTDGDGLNDLIDTDDDGDDFLDTVENACDSDPRDGNSVPERLGNSADDDGNEGIDEVQAAVSGEDCDGDGFDDDVEQALTWPPDDGGHPSGDETVAADQCDDIADDDGDTVVNDGCPEPGTGHQERCADSLGGNNENDDQWPADFNDDGKLNLQDVNYFNVPIKHFGQPAANHQRWNLAGGTDINLQDVNSLNTLKPPMFSGQRAYGNTVYGLAGTCPAD
jgi:hypothetical protein